MKKRATTAGVSRGASRYTKRQRQANLDRWLIDRVWHDGRTLEQMVNERTQARRHT